MTHNVENPDASDLPTLGRLENLFNENMELKSDEEWAAEEADAKKKAGDKDTSSEDADEEGTDNADSETADDDGDADDNAGDDGDGDTDEETADADSESEVDDGDAETDDADTAPRTLRDLAGDKDYSDFLENTLVEVKVDGETSSVPLAKAIKSYQLEGHLNRKLQEAAEARKTFDTEHAERAKAVADQAAELETALQIAAAMLQGEFASVDWAKLQRENQQEFLIQKVNFDQRKGAIVDLFDKLEKGRKDATEKAQKDRLEQFQSYVKEQGEKLINQLPAWADKATADKEMKALRDYLTQEHGFTEKDSAALYDHRWVLIARDAMRYRNSVQKANVQAKKVRKAPKMGKPGASKQTDAKSATLKKERAKLKKTGRMSMELMDSMGLLD